MAFFKHFWANSRTYLDYASSTPLDVKMIDSIPTIGRTILAANPSALHKEGVALKSYLEAARTRVARVLHAHSDEIIFTANATESDNLAISGSVQALRLQGYEASSIVVMCTDIEHAAVIESVSTLHQWGIRTVTIPTTNGVIDPKMIIVPENTRAIVLSVMFVNNEIGTLQPIKEIAKRVRFLRKNNPEVKIIFHTDATQAPLFYELNVQQLGVDMITLGATKLYCPKGVGVLYIKRATPIVPIVYGGGQEHGLRPGTQAVDLIHAFSYALEYAQSHINNETTRIRELQQYFEVMVEAEISHAVITASTVERAPHISHIAIPNFDSELLVIELDARGVAVSSKSACKNEDPDESPLVESIHGKGWGGVRFSFGRVTTKRELRKAVLALQQVLAKYSTGQ